MHKTKTIEEKVFEDPTFRNVKSKLGIDSLRNFVSRLLASKIEKLITDLKKRATEDLIKVSKDLKEQGKFDDDDDDYEDLIAKLVERSMQKIKNQVIILKFRWIIQLQETNSTE